MQAMARSRVRRQKLNYWLEAFLLKLLIADVELSARRLQERLLEAAVAWEEDWRKRRPGEEPPDEAARVLRRLEAGGWTDRAIQRYTRYLRPAAVEIAAAATARRAAASPPPPLPTPPPPPPPRRRIKTRWQRLAALGRCRRRPAVPVPVPAP
jgi:hypothetical protein